MFYININLCPFYNSHYFFVSFLIFLRLETLLGIENFFAC